jgi:xanthine dehydrogenase accessory factor
LDRHRHLLTQALRQGRRVVMVSVSQVQGSAPRDVGAWMAVLDDAQLINTLGGGHLEFEAIGFAMKLLSGEDQSHGQGSKQAIVKRYALGPSLGQCCGGVVHLSFDFIEMKELPAWCAQHQTKMPRLALFGGGHVGRAIVAVMSNLPWQVSWIDSRDDIFPAQIPSNVQVEQSDPVALAVDDLQSDSHVLIMSFSHAEDLDILARCLQKQRSGFKFSSIGLIGSETKWATFQHRLLDKGFTQSELNGVSCPIGVPGIDGKEPEVIAIAVVAKLLMQEQLVCN